MCVTFKVSAMALALAVAAVSMSAADEPGLVLRIHTSADRYRLDDSIRIEARLENASDESITVYGDLRWGRSAGLLLLITDEAGEAVFSRTFDHDLIIPSSFRDRGVFLTLRPNHFLGVHRSDAARDLFPKQGSYTIWLQYQSPVPTARGKGPSFFGREAGTLTSNRLKVLID